jgi:membrane protein DedA with SNARE-associated domain
LHAETHGAAYGHFWGALYVAVGSEAGALIAFGISRLIGYDALRAWLGARLPTSTLHRFGASQNTLMAVVFATRLMPFLSFDIISYAAGLTPLRTWRFAVATFLGIIPASFLLAHFGDEIASGDWRRAGITVLVLGFITLLPVGWKVISARCRSALKRLLSAGQVTDVTAWAMPLPPSARSSVHALRACPERRHLPLLAPSRSACSVRACLTPPTPTLLRPQKPSIEARRFEATPPV